MATGAATQTNYSIVFFYIVLRHPWTTLVVGGKSLCSCTNITSTRSVAFVPVTTPDLPFLALKTVTKLVAS